MKFENIKFSRYRFSPNEKIYVDKDLKEEYILDNPVKNIIVYDFSSEEESEKILKHIVSVLETIKKNPNYLYLGFKLVYSICEDTPMFISPILIVDEITWYFVKGLLIDFDSILIDNLLNKE